MSDLLQEHGAEQSQDSGSHGTRNSRALLVLTRALLVLTRSLWVLTRSLSLWVKKEDIKKLKPEKNLGGCRHCVRECVAVVALR